MRILSAVAALCAASIVWSASAAAQQAYIIPSLYGTSGSYSNGSSSASIDAYALAQIGGNDFLSVAVGSLTIDAAEWTYAQSLLACAGTKNFYPFSLSLRLGMVGGEYSAKQYRYTYTDKIFLVSAGGRYNWDMFYFRADYTHLDLQGYKNVVARQVSIGAEWVASESISLTVSPLYSTLTDGRNLFGVTVGGTFIPAAPLTIRCTGFMGARAYFFDPDLLVEYNQDATQKYLAGLSAEYSVIPELKVSCAYHVTGFSDYTIRYASVGLIGTILL